MSGLFHLFVQGLNLTNSALATNYRSPEVREIFQRYADRFGSGDVTVQLAGCDSDLWFCIRLQPGGFVILSHHRGRPPGTVNWRLQADYLRELADNSLHYLKHPGQLDWHWLYAGPDSPPANSRKSEAACSRGGSGTS